MKQLTHYIAESLSSVLPIAAIVLVLSITIAPVRNGVLVQFIFGTILLIVGMSFFTIGSSISMQPLGEGIGAQLSKTKSKTLPLLVCLVLGILITVAEPDLQVLAEQVSSIPNTILVVCVACGVGAFLMIAMLRIRKEIPLSRLLLLFYGVVLVLAFFVSDEFIPTAFDSGGVTTGPVTVPFIMALGTGMAAVGNNKRTNENSFGLVALCSIGPILSVLILSICYNPEPEVVQETVVITDTTAEAFMQFVKELPKYGKEVLNAFLPVVAVFAVFSLVFRRFRKNQIIRMSVGLAYTYIGLVLFLTGANVGFMPAGRLLGAKIADSTHKYLLIPVGMLMGYFVVSAEPAVQTLKRQVEEVTNGAISQKSIGYALSIGVAVSVGISMLRVLTGISIFPFLIAGYAVALIITFLVPPIYTGIAFDSGGVASGPMTTTFMLPFAVGACQTLGGNVMTDAFGIVAMIAMTPLITIQVMGLYGQNKRKKRVQQVHNEFSQIDDDILCYEEVSA